MRSGTYLKLLDKIKCSKTKIDLLNLQAELTNLGKNWPDFQLRFKHLLLRVEARKWQLMPEKSFSSAGITSMCNDARRLLHEAGTTRERPPVDDPKLFSLLLHFNLLIAEFQMHLLRSNTEPHNTQDERGTIMPKFCLNDLLDHCWTCQEAWERTLFEDKKFLGKHEWDQEFASILEWCFQASEKNSEMEEHFLFLLMRRNCSRSNVGLQDRIQKYSFKYLIVQRTQNERQRFELFSKQFEFESERLAYYDMVKKIKAVPMPESNAVEVDETYLQLIRQFLLLMNPYMQWSMNFICEADDAHFAKKSEKKWIGQILTLRILMKNTMGLHLSCARMDLSNVIREMDFLSAAFNNIKQHNNLHFKGAIHLDTLLSGFILKMMTNYLHKIREFSTYYEKLERNTVRFFDNKKEAEFFSGISSSLRSSFSYMLKKEKNKPADSLKSSAFEGMERKLIVEFFVAFTRYQVGGDPSSCRAIFSRYSELLSFLCEQESILFINLVNTIKDLFDEHERINKRHLTETGDLELQSKIDQDTQRLALICEARRLAPAPVAENNASVSEEKPAENRPEKAPVQNTATMLPQDKWTVEFNQAKTASQKATAALEVMRAYKKSYQKNKNKKNIPKIRKWMEEFFKIVLLENGENENLGDQSKAALGVLESLKAVLFQEDLTLAERLQNMSEEFLRKSLDATSPPSPRAAENVEPILNLLNTLGIVPFSREAPFAEAYLSRDENAWKVVCYLRERFRTIIFGGAIRDMLVEKNRTKKPGDPEIKPNDLDICAAGSRANLLAYLRDGFGEKACTPIGRDQINYIKIKFPDGAEVDVTSLSEEKIPLREEKKEPFIVAVYKKLSGTNFAINSIAYDVNAKVLYDPRRGIEAIEKLEFPFVDEYNKSTWGLGSLGEPIFKAMDLLAKYLPFSVTFKLSDLEVFFKKLETFKFRQGENGHLNVNISLEERIQVNNAVIKLFCRGYAGAALKVCLAHEDFTVLFPSLLDCVGNKSGLEYLEKCCAATDTTFTENNAQLRNAQYDLRESYWLALFFCPVVLEREKSEEIDTAVRAHLQACLFWISPKIEKLVGSLIQKTTMENSPEIPEAIVEDSPTPRIFAVAKTWLENVHSKASSEDCRSAKEFA